LERRTYDQVTATIGPRKVKKMKDSRQKTTVDSRVKSDEDDRKRNHMPKMRANAHEPSKTRFHTNGMRRQSLRGAVLMHL
jgi:hypothetical protein